MNTRSSVDSHERATDPERLAVGTALYQDRRIVVFGGWLIVALSMVLLYIGLSLRSDTAGPLTMAAWTALALFSVVMAMLLQFAGREQFYNVILGWMGMIHLGVFGQLTNFYFGNERQLILQGTLPVLLLAIPVALVWARSMLKSPDANLLNGLLLLGLAGMTASHALLFWSSAPTRYAMSLMLAMVFVVGPLLELMMRQHYRIQFKAQLGLHQALARAQQEANDARWHSLLDPLTGLLNRSGVQTSLDASLHEHAQTGLARISIANLEALREKRPETDVDALLQDFATALQEAAGENHQVGRIDGGDFDIWGACDDDEAAWEALCQRVCNRLQAQFADTKDPLKLRMAAAVFARGTGSAVALEEISFRSFMSSVRA